MSDITEKLAAALAEESSFIGPNPLHAALIEAIGALEPLDGTFCNINQLIDGWNHDGSWSEWDASVRKESGEAHKKVFEALARLRECLGEK